jgi:hypothetical protein
MPSLSSWLPWNPSGISRRFLDFGEQILAFYLMAQQACQGREFRAFGSLDDTAAWPYAFTN